MTPTGSYKQLRKAFFPLTNHSTPNTLASLQQREGSLSRDKRLEFRLSSRNSSTAAKQRWSGMSLHARTHARRLCSRLDHAARGLSHRTKTENRRVVTPLKVFCCVVPVPPEAHQTTIVANIQCTLGFCFALPQFQNLQFDVSHSVFPNLSDVP